MPSGRPASPRAGADQTSDVRQAPPVRWLETLRIADVPLVGGKNASLGEMISALEVKGIRIPGGFATTSDAYWLFLRENRLAPMIQTELTRLSQGNATLEETGMTIRRLIGQAKWPAHLAAAIRNAYRELCKRYGQGDVDVAVRSSATAEDLPEASFAGQQETFLNVRGEEAVLDACRRCYASLFTDRAIVYRQNHGYDHLKVALSVGVQKMVRSDEAGAGVVFTLDTETGFPNVVLINAAWGLGETVVQGTVNPDQFLVFKPFLRDPNLDPILEKNRGGKRRKRIYSDDATTPVLDVETTEAEQESFVLRDSEILDLARWAVIIEEHFGRPMDIEWAKDGPTGELFVVQARPETVQAQRKVAPLKTYRLRGEGPVLVRGLSIGTAIASGPVSRILAPSEIAKVKEGSILVTEMTDPDWVPVMRNVAGIITDAGGRTCHAAIVSREMGIPAIVGTGNATNTLADGQEVTLSCAGGDEGRVYAGRIPFDVEDVDVGHSPLTKTGILMNIGTPGSAFHWWRLPTDGVGLARMEFIVGNIIKVHPMALAHPERVKDEGDLREIARLTSGYSDPCAYFVDQLSRGIAKIAAANYPKPVIVRTSDFKTNEYANLIGGRGFEPVEENPMIGWRGASRYYREGYRDGFALECQALKRVRNQMGFTNVIVMIPFCRTLEEADKVLATMAENGLRRGENGLEVYVMCEIPSNVILADQFSTRFDGFSIGSNDLTQLTLGVDRDSALLSEIFDERNEAVKRLIRMVIDVAHQHGRKVGICGQAPSDYPEFVSFLVDAGIDSISLNPDSVMAVRLRVHAEEERRANAPSGRP